MSRNSFAALLVAMLLAFAGACADAIVGAECKDDYQVCDGLCIDPRNDFRHCGSCGNDCGAFICDEGTCTGEPRPDASVDGSFPDLDGGGADGMVGDAGDRDSGTGVSPDAGTGGCGLGEADCGGACVRLVSDPDHCGACDMACPGDQFCASGSCAPTCDAPLESCGGRCIEVHSDPANCGGCDVRCKSGICSGSACADAVPGHVVVVGHDYREANDVMRRLAGNAVFLASGAPVEVLTYEGSVNVASRDGVMAALDFVAQQDGRPYQETVGEESLITLQLGDADVFLIHAQESSDSVLEKLAQQWGNAMAQFVLAGGVIVVFETNESGNSGTYTVLQGAQLFSAASRASIPDQVLEVISPGVGVARGVPGNYMGAQRSSHFQAISTPGAAVVEDDGSVPVIFHRIVR